MFVCTRWSSMAAILLVMSTLQLFLALSTVQSSMVLDIVHKVFRASSNSSIFTTNRNTTLIDAPFGQSWFDVQQSLVPALGRHHIPLQSNLLLLERNSLSRDSHILDKSAIPPDALGCLDTLNTTVMAIFEVNLCMLFQKIWLTMLNYTGASRTEYSCKQLYTTDYCSILAARTYCSYGQFDSLHAYVKQSFEAEARFCGEWHNWLPPLYTPSPTPTKSAIVSVAKCTGAFLSEKSLLDECGSDGAHKIDQATLDNRIEAECKLTYEKQQCFTKFACSLCDRESAHDFLNFTASLWSPKAVECTKWAHFEPKMECLQPEGEKCRTQVEIHGRTERDAVDRIAQWINLARDDVERECKMQYYAVYRLNLAACGSCTASGQLAPYQTYLAESLEPYRDECTLWHSWLPKIKCIPNATALMVKMDECAKVLNKHDALTVCGEEALRKGYGHVEVLEGLCKTIYFQVQCFIEDMACKYCDNSAHEILQFMKNEWNPTEVECTKWSSLAPTFECHNFHWWIVGLVLVSLVAILLIVLVVVVICCTRQDGDGARSASSVARSRAQNGGGGQGQLVMQPMGTMQPIQQNGPIQPGTIQPYQVMQPIGTIQPAAGPSMQPIRV